jgi:hypothetical protein
MSFTGPPGPPGVPGETGRHGEMGKEVLQKGQKVLYIRGTAKGQKTVIRDR